MQLKFEGTGGLAYQIVGRYFTPWEDEPAAEPLSIDVAYDRTHLAQNDIAHRHRYHPQQSSQDCQYGYGRSRHSARLRPAQRRPAGFPGENTGAKAGRLEKFSLTATQAILYFNALAPKQTVTLKVRLRAKYPIRARTFQSRVYEYYDPEVNSTTSPVRIEVNEH